MSLDPQTYKQVMSQWPSGVTVVTSQHNEQRVGITVSSFSSVSLEPPLVSVCISKNLFTHELITQSKVFAVNILSAQQVELGKIFAGYYKRNEDRFAGLDVRVGVTGSPILPDTLAWLDCKVHQVYDGGDHTIFVGAVLGVGFPKTATPLLYHNRTWGRFARPMPERVELVEVGLFNALHSGNHNLSTQATVEIINLLIDAGVKRIQIPAFRNPEPLPSGTEAESLYAKLTPRDGVIFTSVVVNQYGLERAHAAGIRHGDIVISASEAHSRKFSNKSLEMVMQEFEKLLKNAHKYGMEVRGVIGCAFGCSLDSEIGTKRVIARVKQCLEFGVDTIGLDDTHGMANPKQIQDLLGSILPLTGKTPVALQLRDTRGMGLANVLAALGAGVSHFDTALGVLGNQPAIFKIPSPISTEDMFHMLHEMGLQTDINVARLSEVSLRIEERLIRALGDNPQHHESPNYPANGNLRE